MLNTPSFESLFEEADKIKPWTTFTIEECRAYYNLAIALPEGSTVLEIGLQFGRSTRIVAPICRDHKLYYFGVDPFIDPPEAGEAWREWMLQNHCPYGLIPYKSTDRETKLALSPATLSLALIDGDHSAEAVESDINLVLPLVIPGGHVCFHDYDHNGPHAGVTQTVDRVMAQQPKFQPVMQYWTLMVFRRVFRPSL